MEESIIYVDINATEGENNGSSWGNAYTDLQSALAVAGASDQIWVAAGTYLPTNGTNLPEDIEDPREVNFVINNGVKVYGGFAGGETSLAQRDRFANPTILSGNIGEDTQADNSYHVVDISDSPASTVIDGFTITGGQADGDGGFSRQDHGGGFYGDTNASATLQNLTIQNNFAADDGGGIHIDSNSGITVNSVIFNNNSSGASGGAISATGNDLNVFNSLFINNQGAGDGGGAIYTGLITTTNIVGNTFYNNQGGDSDDFFDDSSSFDGRTISNNIFADNNAIDSTKIFFDYSVSPPANGLNINSNIIDGTAGFRRNGVELSNFGEGNINEDPLFVNPENNNFRLSLNSPGIDAGDNNALTGIAEDTDVRGNPRIYNETVDLGSAEYGLYLDIDDVTVTEGNQGTTEATFTVTLLDTLGQPATQQISVNYGTADDSANAATDFTPTSGTLVFSPGDTEQTITVPVSTDTQPEEDETFFVNLANPTGNAVIRDNRGVGLVIDDDVSREGDTVFRLLNPEVGVHFYTTDVAERDEFIASGNYNSEGASFTSVDPEAEGAEEVYRFFNATTGVHLYTTEEVERDSIQENLSDFAFEGEVFNAYATEVEGSIPVYRFYNPSLGVHFYTPNEAERDSVEANLPNYESEGVAYYAFPLEE